MRDLVNQHSYLLVAAVALTVFWAVFRRAFRWLRRLVLIGLLAALLLGFLALRPGRGGGAGAADLDAALRTGRPVIVHVYSNY